MKYFKLGLIGAVALIVAGCTGEGGSSTGSGGGIASSGAGTVNEYNVDDGATLNVTNYGVDSGLPPCDGTSPTAKAEGRCI